MADDQDEGMELPVQPVEIVDDSDWFLEQMIDGVINEVGAEIGITLMVGGATISGILISGKNYFTELSKQVTEASKVEGDLPNVLAKHWQGYSAIYEKPEGAPEDWQPPRVNFIHLKNAYVFAPGQEPLPNNRGMLWRGRVNAIDGWSLAHMTPPQ